MDTSKTHFYSLELFSSIQVLQVLRSSASPLLWNFSLNNRRKVMFPKFLSSLLLKTVRASSRKNFHLFFFHYFRDIYKIWKETFPRNCNVFFTRCLPIAFTMFVHVYEREYFFHEIVANLPLNATEIVRFLRTFKVRFLQIDGFFEQKL